MFYVKKISFSNIEVPILKFNTVSLDALVKELSKDEVYSVYTNKEDAIKDSEPVAVVYDGRHDKAPSVDYFIKYTIFSEENNNKKVTLWADNIDGAIPYFDAVVKNSSRWYSVSVEGEGFKTYYEFSYFENPSYVCDEVDR